MGDWVIFIVRIYFIKEYRMKNKVHAFAALQILIILLFAIAACIGYSTNGSNINKQRNINMGKVINTMCPEMYL